MGRTFNRTCREKLLIGVNITSCVIVRQHAVISLSVIFQFNSSAIFVKLQFVTFTSLGIVCYLICSLRINNNKSALFTKRKKCIGISVFFTQENVTNSDFI